VRGLLDTVDDPYTQFLDPEEAKALNDQNDGEFVGIGARIDLKEEYSGGPQALPVGASRPYIVEPMQGGPAQKAGLKRDDVILSIDGQNLSSLTVLQNEMRLRRPGDVVKHEILRYGDRIEKEVIVERGW